MENQTKFLTQNEVADLIGVSRRTFQRMRADGNSPPSYRFDDRIIRFREDEVLTWIEGQKDDEHG